MPFPYPQTRFLTSAWQPSQFPDDTGTEVAFVGRSNAGKSSALNAIVARSGLARTSKTPGRTQLINFFELTPQRRLVDLPGYGFAKVPEKMQRHWQVLMRQYWESRAALSGVVIIMDARRPLMDFDWMMLEWTDSRELPAHLLLTKADKLSRSAAMQTLKETEAQIGAPHSAQLFSAVEKTGLDTARGAVEHMLTGG